jgi:hypothetical protein
VGTLYSVIETLPLLAGTSAQKAELITFTWALEITAGVQVNIYIESKYASQPFISMGQYIRKGAILTQEEKVSSMGRKSSNC